MTSLPRPLMVGLGVIPPALMILTKHPWMGLTTFTAMLGAVLLHTRIESEAARARDREILSYARHATDLGEDPVRVVEALAQGRLRPVPDQDRDDEDRPRPSRDGLIHYPPRRLPL